MGPGQDRISDKKIIRLGSIYTQNNSKYAIFHYAQEYSSPNFTRVGASRPGSTRYSPRRFAPRLERLPRTFGARARCSLRYHAAIQKYRRQSARPICLGIRSPRIAPRPLPMHLYSHGYLESTPRPRAIISTKCAR
jgi:hypothetical protein